MRLEGENACCVGFDSRRRGGSSDVSTKPRFEGFGHSTRGGVFGWLGTPSASTSRSRPPGDDAQTAVVAGAGALHEARAD